MMRLIKQARIALLLIASWPGLAMGAQTTLSDAIAVPSVVGVPIRVVGSAPGLDPSTRLEGKAMLLPGATPDGKIVEITWQAVKDGNSQKLQALASPLSSRVRTTAPFLPAGTALTLAGDESALSTAGRLLAASLAAPSRRQPAYARNPVTKVGCDQRLMPAGGGWRLQEMERDIVDGRPGACRPAGPGAPVIAVADGCRIVPDIKAAMAREETRLVDSAGVERAGCALRRQAGRSWPIQKSLTGCSLIHDFSAGNSQGETALSIAGDGGREVIVRRCVPDPLRVLEHEKRGCGPLQLPNEYHGIMSAAALAQSRTVIRMEGGEELMIRVCQPDGPLREGGAVLDSEPCEGIWVHDKLGSVSYGTHRWYVKPDGDAGKIYLTSCIQDPQQSYRHDFSFSGWRHDDARHLSRRLARVFVSVPTGEMEIMRDYAPDGFEQVHKPEQALVAAGAVQAAGCETWQRRTRRVTWTRPDGSSYQTEAGPGPSLRVTACPAP